MVTNGDHLVVCYWHRKKNWMTKPRDLILIEEIEPRILLIRGQKVLVDADLAELYGTTTKRLNEQVRRNRQRFPTDFVFQLTSPEKEEVVANCDHLTRLKFSPVLPNAFTEHDEAIRSLLSAIHELMAPPPDPPKGRFGFHMPTEPRP